MENIADNLDDKTIELHRYSTTSYNDSDLKGILDNVKFTQPCCTSSRCLKFILPALLLFLLVVIGGLSFMVYHQQKQIHENRNNVSRTL